ncbi:MMPL family transporter [Tumebacillus sp. ITR2]|uniref:MMPL family transporter n=2 Tax=Tumebacillus amylolyticus TaxID=2801339 RepID=A0ABS1J6B2_9BACL|nr:MMPL family transporter [Tumebacillus amylolyticus]
MASGKRGAKIVVGLWLAFALVLSFLAPSSKLFAVNSNSSDLPAGLPSEVASVVREKHFPTEDGLTALLVFHEETPLTEEQQTRVAEVSRLLSEENLQGVATSTPLYQMPAAAWGPFFSEDRTTLMLPVSLKKDLDSHGVREVVQQINELVQTKVLGTLHVSITGPAGISSDAIGVFQNADFVLMLTSVVLILILLILLYRSPLLAVVPLVMAGILYEIADRLLGLGAKNGMFVVESQALSIMMILLFAVLTDYALFVFSRYRDELRKTSSQYEAMQEAMKHVGEPIFFSGSIILVSVLTLSVALFKPYQHFAPVFGVALVVVLLGGLTLIPAGFALLGRKAFWPFLPRVGEVPSAKLGLWDRMGRLVTKKPRLLAGGLTLLLLGASLFIGNIQFSYNLLKSFPGDTPSRVGFETLQQHFPPGALAPSTVLVESRQTLDAGSQTSLENLRSKLSEVSGVKSVTLGKNALSSDLHAAQLQLVLSHDPYDPAAMQTVVTIREEAQRFLQDSGFDSQQVSLHVAGQTATQLDTRTVNDRDTKLVLVLVTLLTTVLLIFQSRSLIAPIYMMGTILLTYATSLGITWVVFHNLLGYESISYRIPLYSFVFLVALGVDYNILLLSRIREEVQHADLPTAIRRAVSVTGKTISSAGLILVATFSVLMTQPLLELVLFGFVVGLGVLIDTFLVRSLLMPSIMLLLGRWNWWPGRKQN